MNGSWRNLKTELFSILESSEYMYTHLSNHKKIENGNEFKKMRTKIILLNAFKYESSYVTFLDTKYIIWLSNFWKTKINLQ